MKKIILISLFILLSGCATTNPQPMPQQNAAILSAGLVTDNMAHNMTPEDANKIFQLIDTSQSQDKQTWRNNITKDTFEFTSLNIGVNSQGLPCRTYEIKSKINGRLQDIQVKACRGLNGSWQAVSSSIISKS